MKYALTLLFILALGFFTSQAINIESVAHGYNLAPSDKTFLQDVYKK